MQLNGKKAAFLFSGQGVQTSIICEHYKFLKSQDSENTGKFIKILQDSLDKINLQEKFGVEESLANETLSSWLKTSFVQPLTYVLSILTFELLREREYYGYLPEYVLGHSLGAFSALTAAGCLPFEQGCRVVTVRGKFMQEESEKANSGMCAIIGLTKNKVREICRKNNAEVALINAPTAFVVGCSRSIFPQIEREVAMIDGAKTIRLGTSGAYHTKMMQGAYEKFKEYFDKYPLLKPRIPVVCNMKGSATTDIEEIRYDCIESIINPVNWVGMMDFLKNNKVMYYIESGPGTSLSSLSRMNGVEKERILHGKTMLG